MFQCLPTFDLADGILADGAGQLGILHPNSINTGLKAYELSCKSPRKYPHKFCFPSIIGVQLLNPRCYERHNGDTAIDDVNRILCALIGMLEKEVAANTKASAQFFSVLARFAETGVAQCKQVCY